MVHCLITYISAISHSFVSHINFLQTTYHGFPSGPSALSFDAENQFLVVGTKLGELRVFGRPGVEFRAVTASKSPLTTILCLSAVHQVVTVAENNTITAWELNTDAVPVLNINNKLTIDRDGYVIVCMLLCFHLV